MEGLVPIFMRAQALGLSNSFIWFYMFSVGTADYALSKVALVSVAVQSLVRFYS